MTAPSVSVFSFFEFLFPLDSLRSFFFSEIPHILKLSAQSLEKAGQSAPVSFLELTSMKGTQVLDLLPAFCAVLTVVLIVCSSLQHQKKDRPIDSQGEDLSESYVLSSKLILQGQGLCYLAAYATTAFQFRGLAGPSGLNPGLRIGWRPAPVFDFLEMVGIGFEEKVVEVVCWVGVLLSLLMAWGGSSGRSFFVVGLLWAGYLSLINGGAAPINYGWEWTTVESGFLCIGLAWLAPAEDGGRPSKLLLWLFRWLGFRVMLGAGLSKRGTNSSACWASYSCTLTHYETQPLPNPLAWVMHNFPPEVHYIEGVLVWFEQLILPWGALIPLRSVRLLTAAGELFFQMCVVGSGNYAWINYVAFVPFLALVDDQFILNLFPTDSAAAFRKSFERAEKYRLSVIGRGLSFLRSACILYASAVIIFLSKEPVKELFSPSPWLHFYDPFFLVNANGVFGFVNTERVQLTLEFTHDPLPPSNPSRSCKDAQEPIANSQGKDLFCWEVEEACDHPHFKEQISSLCPRTCGMCPSSVDDAQVAWSPLEFRSLPGSPSRRPIVNSPYHYRLDWEVWIRTTASMEKSGVPSNRVPSIVSNLVQKLLEGDTDAAQLVLTSVFKEGMPPTAIRTRYWKYHLSPLSSSVWWTRELYPKGDKVWILPDFQGTGRKGIQDTPRRSPYERQWMLLGGVLGMAKEIISVFDSPSVENSLNSRVMSLAKFVGFCVIFGGSWHGDYSVYSPSIWNGLWKMLLGVSTLLLSINLSELMSKEGGVRRRLSSISDLVLATWLCWNAQQIVGGEQNAVLWT